MRESDVWGDISNVTDVGVTREGYSMFFKETCKDPIRQQRDSVTNKIRIKDSDWLKARVAH